MISTDAKHAALLGPRDTERALAAWREHDAAHALHGPDRQALAATDAPRALVLEHLVRPGSAASARDLYSACARLGRLLADAGASPSFAVSTIDGASQALQHVGAPFDDARLAPARASVAEGYVAAVVEGERARARLAWEYPACAVPVSDVLVAVVAGYPAEDDREGLADWAARVALAVSRAGYRSAIVAGGDVAVAELTQSLGLIGVATITGADGPAAPAERPAWFDRFASLLRR